MGAGFVRAALKRGETVRVWNRSADKAKALESDGAQAFADAAEAVRGASRVHITLSDDAAVDAVLATIAGSLEPGAAVIDHTTTAPTPTVARYETMAKTGAFFAHVPMFMGPANALASTGLMLTSGPDERKARVREIVTPMTGKLVDVGSGDDRAAAFKLFGNTMLFFITAGLADVFKFGQSLGISPLEAHSLFADFKPGGLIDARGKNMAEGNFQAAFELVMARKDVRLVLEEAARQGTELSVLPAIASLMDRGIASGHGTQDMGVIAAL
jgi:3-hydroxyisobutyrate dehydrogenase